MTIGRFEAGELCPEPDAARREASWDFGSAPRGVLSHPVVSDAAAAIDPVTEAEVRAEQIRALYRQSVWVFLANPINAVIVSLVLWAAASRPLLLWWTGAMGAITAARLLLRWQYRRVAPTLDQSRIWGMRFVSGTTLIGLAWGLGAALLYDRHNPALQLFVIFIVGGMVAGASGTLAFYVPAFLGFGMAALLPISVRLAVEGDPMRIAMAVLVLVFGTTLILVALNTQRSLTESIRLRFVNEHLLKRLSSAQTSLEEINRTLEERVVERGAALERQGQTLRDAQRMESVGLLAGGVAHDFNNLLTVVMANVDLLSSDRSFGPAAHVAVNEIREAGSRAAALVSQLLAFGRRQLLVPKVLDLNAVVRDMQGLLSRLIGDHVDLAVAFCPRRLLTMADPRQIEQVIINLASNARDAMPNGGRLLIETDHEDVGHGGASSEPAGVPSGSYAVLTVRDSGVGMDSETKRQVFDPFFTTKPLGKGTGLGLATVYGIVDQSGGHIVVESQPGAGSRFKIYLPHAAEDAAGVADEAAPLESAASTAATPRAGKPSTILVAEDHALLRGALSRVLLDLGHEMLIAEDGAQALEMSRAHRGEIDLVITDVVMAKMGGLELAAHLATERPHLRVLFTSGYSRDKALPALDPERGVDFLRKPFSAQELADKVARLLDVVRTPAMGNPATQPDRHAGSDS
jgi:signal transduction histidine kinase/CheY-like chemotaxis protein